MAAFPIDLAVNWILFFALFPMAFIWLRRAYKIFVKKDYSEVALKKGEGPKDPKKWAPFTGTVNLLAGATAVITILGVLAALLPFKIWSAMGGITLWIKLFADYVISRQAHPFVFGKKKKEQNAQKS